MNTQAAVIVEGLVNQFGDHIVHNGIDLQVRRGEILSIVGGSGSGKTVLLNSMTGLHRPNAGKVQLLDTDLIAAPARQVAALRNRIGVVFQAGALFSALSVFDNIAFPIRELHTIDRTLLCQLTRLKLNMVGLAADDGAKFPAQLSGGMRTRAALARALALDPEILFLDEPTSGLDPVSAERFVDLILELREALELTVVMVTHDLYTLMSLSHRIAVLADQSIVALGEPAHVMKCRHPFIEAYFRTLRGFSSTRGGR